MIDSNQVSAIAKTFAILGDPTRLHILRVLMQSPRTVGNITDTLGFKQANVSKQLSVLLRAGLVSRSRSGNSVTYRIANPMVRRLCKVVCRV